MKFTPGPWTAQFDEVYCVTDQDNGRVAMVTHLKGWHGMGGRRSGDESAANARLIAAAPEMYEALLDAVRVLGDLPSTNQAGTRTRAAWERARTVLAKVNE